jgi:hypothetical protein
MLRLVKNLSDMVITLVRSEEKRTGVKVTNVSKSKVTSTVNTICATSDHDEFAAYTGVLISP